MPLVRYEIRNEYSLANPDLYRAAAKDDPEGLLEGVAMAGLVGIVRQLGDLAEFAAEVFHDLHEEILATAARGHELGMRVQQLESELPFIEKMMLSETKNNHDTFIYSQGIVWHSSVRNNQNHFTQGDLPHFIRNAYEKCREAPRLSLLDKFDVAGAGACLKRYTDPFFFKMEWASTELMKAEKEQQERRARRIKKKRQAVDISSRTSENVTLKASEDGSRMLKDVYTSPVMQRQAVDKCSLTSENVALRASEDGSRMLKDVYASPVMERQAVTMSSQTSKTVALRASEDGSRMLKDVYTGPIMERQALDISSRTSEDGSRMIKNTFTDPIVARQPVEISSRTAENVVLRISEDGSEMLKEQSYTASVMQRQAVDNSSKTSENVNLLKSDDGTRILKDAFTVPAIQRQAGDISSDTSENVALRTSGHGSRMLEDAHIAPAMQRQGVDINSKEAENVTFKVAEDALRMSENGDSKDSILRESVDSTFRTAQPAALSIAEDAALRMPEKSITGMSADNILRISEDNVVRMSEDAILRMSDDAVQRMSEDPVLNISEDSVRSMGEDAAPRISEGPTLRTSDDDVLRAIEIADDFASETENFVDALTTMDSEVETDTEMKVKFEDDEGDYFITSDKISSKNLAKTDSQIIMMDEENLYNDCKNEEQQVIIGMSSVMINDRSHEADVEEHTANVEFTHDLSERDFPHEDHAEEEIGKMHMPDKESTVERIDLVQQVSRLNIDGDVQNTMERIDPVQQVSLLNIDGDLQRTMESIEVVQHVSRLNIDGDAQYKHPDSAIEKEQVEKVEESPRHINASVDTYSLLGRNNGILKTEDHYESESIENIPETPETSESDDGESVEMEKFSELPVSTSASGDGSRGKFPKWRRSHSSDRQLQSTNDGFYKGLSASDLSSVDSESELSDSLKGTSPRSSPDSSIRPIKWVSKSHDGTSGSDDDMDGIQVSSASSSTLSSPRPSTLATTVFSVDLKISTPSPDRSVEPSLVSHLSESSKPVANTTSPVSTRAISPDICAVQSTEVLESPLSESFIGPPAEPLESPNSKVLKFTAAEPLISVCKPMIFTPDEALGSAVEAFRYPREDSKFPSLEPLKSLADPLITDASRSSAAHLSLQSGFPIQQKYSTSSSFVDVEPEQFPPPPPLPPRQWLMSKRPQKTISPTIKEEESHIISAPGNVSTVSNMQLKDFHPFTKEFPASKILQSPEWPVNTLELQYTPAIIGEESPHVAGGSLQKPPVSLEVLEPAKIDIFQARHDNSPVFQDSPFNVNNLVSSQVIKTSSTNHSSYESLFTRSHIHMEALKPSGTTKEESSVEENDIVHSVFPTSSQDYVSLTTGLVNNEIVMKRDEQLESCSNLRQLSSEGSLDSVDHLQDFDASNTSHHDSQKLPIIPKETRESFELPPMEFTVDSSSPSVNGKRDTADVSTAVFSSGNIQKYPILGDLENVNECSLSHSSIQGSRFFVDSPSSSSVCKGTVSPGSKDDDHMPATELDRLQSVGTYLPDSGETVEIMSSPEQFDNVVNSKTVRPARLQKKDPLIEAIASHDRSTLKKVPELSQSSRTAPPDERGVLLEQIRNRSFSLRQIKVEKQAVPQPVTNINVAAILEKANAIRQAFAGSDDEDDWSDG